MIESYTKALRRSDTSLVSDAFGVLALLVILFGALHL